MPQTNGLEVFEEATYDVLLDRCKDDDIEQIKREIAMALRLGLIDREQVEYLAEKYFQSHSPLSHGRTLQS